MGCLNVGGATLTLPDGVEIPAKAGHMTPAEANTLADPRKGVGLVASFAADVMRKTGLAVPNMTPDQLEAQGENAEKLDKVIKDVESMLHILNQANLIADAEAFTSVRMVYAQVQAQAKFDPQLKERFSALFDYFSRGKGATKLETSK